MTEVPTDSVVLSLRGSCLDIAQDLAHKLKAFPNSQHGVELSRLLDSRWPSDEWRGSVLSIHVPIVARAAAILGLREPVALIGAIAERYDAHRIEAARALGELGANEAEGALLEALKDKSPWARAAVLQALYAVKATTVGPIIAALRAKEPFVRAEAARVIGGVGGLEVVPRLLTMLEDEQTRDGAILGLWRPFERS